MTEQDIKDKVREVEDTALKEMEVYKPFARRVWQALLKFLWTQKELLTIPLAFLMLWVSPTLIRIFYPAAGDLDLAVVSRVFYFVFELFVLHGTLWILWKITWEPIAEYLDIDFFEDFKTLEKWQKLRLVSFLWSAYLCFVGLLVLGGVMG